MATTARRRDARGRYLPTYTLRWTHAHPDKDAVTTERAGRTAREVERFGTLLLLRPEEEVYDIAVLNTRGVDVTFGFACFQD